MKFSDWMEKSGVKFGTSGARGLVRDMTDATCFAYTLGFLQYLEKTGELKNPDTPVLISGDLRSSTPRILTAVAGAIQQTGYKPVYAGLVPTPALALGSWKRNSPSIMVTGSHIPDDRNGIKYNKTTGELLKSDEQELLAENIVLPADLFTEAGNYLEGKRPQLPVAESFCAEEYAQRYQHSFPRDFLKGIRLGYYQHSAVGRDLIPAILTELGAEIIPLARSDKFISVDTEAIRPEDEELAEKWARKYKFDAILTTDGDSDRPLVADENGQWIRGDVAGILTSLFFQVDFVALPISCNSALELSKKISKIQRTRIGSPHVLEGMHNGMKQGFKFVVGYEANGGFLTGTPLRAPGGGDLAALPTRDTLIVFLAILGISRLNNIPLSGLHRLIPPRFTASDRIQNFPADKSGKILNQLQEDSVNKPAEIKNKLSTRCGPLTGIDLTDGVRMSFSNGEIAHFRASGNAPEFRCYTEASSIEAALALNRFCLDLVSA